MKNYARKWNVLCERLTVHKRTCEEGLKTDVTLLSSTGWPLKSTPMTDQHCAANFVSQQVHTAQGSCLQVVPKLSQTCPKVVSKSTLITAQLFSSNTMSTHCSKNWLRLAPIILITADNYDREYNWWELHLPKSCLSTCVANQILLFSCNPKILILIFCNCYTIQIRPDQVNNGNSAIIFLVNHWSVRIVRVLQLIRAV